MTGAGEPSRVWTIELPAGMRLLNANDRVHWAKKARITRQLRDTACWLARHQKIPTLRCARIIAEYRPPDRRRRDPANWSPSAKAAVDGLVDAGVLPDDDARHLVGPDMRIGQATPRGQLVLRIHEINAESPAEPHDQQNASEPSACPLGWPWPPTLGAKP